MIVAGLGCRRGASAADVEAAVRAALAAAGLRPGDVSRFATSEGKGDEFGLRDAARAFGRSLLLVPKARLDAAAARASTKSERVLALFGLPSIAETAALAEAGPDARLLAPRSAVGAATCALALGEHSAMQDVDAR